MKKISFGFILFVIFSVKVFGLTELPIDITKKSMSEIIDLLDKEVITSEELVNVYLERIDKYNSTFSSVIFINDSALEEAKELDKLRESGKIKGKLHGVPIIVKANIDVFGIPTTAGSKSLSDNYPNEDAEVVKKLKDSGAIIIGSANMSQFAFSADTSSSNYGTVKNAFNTLYSSYGSSGGVAVSVALSFASAGIGTDTNSSVRAPSSANSVVGLRPSTGLLSNDGVIPYDPNRDTVGPITKTVEDNKIIMEVLTGKTYKSIKDLKGIKIGVIKKYLYGDDSELINQNKATFSGITELSLKAVDDLKNKGAKIVYIDELINSKYQALDNSLTSGFLFCSSFNEYIKNTTGSVRDFSSLVSSGYNYGLSGYYSSCNSTLRSNYSELKQEFRDYIDSIFDDNDIDVIIYPTTKNSLSLLSNTSTFVGVGSNFVSAVGYPSITVPMGLYEELPYGLDFFGKLNDEETLLNIAEIYNTKTYTSSLAPSLYETKSNIEELVELFINSDSSLMNKKYKKIIKNYKTITDEEINSIISISKKAKTVHNYKYIILILLLFLIVFRKKKTKKKRKLKSLKKILNYKRKS